MPDSTVTNPSITADTAATSGGMSADSMSSMPVVRFYRPVFTGYGPLRDNSVTNGTVNTVIIDSIAADTVSGRIPHFIPAEKADSMRLEAVADSMRSLQPIITETPSGRREGLSPSALKASDSNSTPVTALLMGTLLFMCLNSGGIGQALKSYRHELIGIRRRRNVFDDEHTASLPMAVLLALNLIVFGGIVLYNIPGLPPAPCIGAATLMMAVTGGYYLFRYIAYKIVGYVFADPVGRRQWVDGFLATEAYTGLFLIIPALLLVFMPQWHDTLIMVSLSIITVGRFLFIAKGARIFYVNLRSFDLRHLRLYAGRRRIVLKLILTKSEIQENTGFATAANVRKITLFRPRRKTRRRGRFPAFYQD